MKTVSFLHPVTGKKVRYSMWLEYESSLNKFQQIGMRLYIKRPPATPAEIVKFVKNGERKAPNGYMKVKDILPDLEKLLKESLVPATPWQVSKYFKLQKNLKARACRRYMSEQTRRAKKLAKKIDDARKLLSRYGLKNLVSQDGSIRLL
jgi:hypothetical protein